MQDTEKNKNIENEQEIENDQKSEKYNWFKDTLYPNISEIEKHAKENTNPYKITVLVLIAIGLVMGIFIYGLIDAILELIIISPILYLICRNYRLGYGLMIIYYSISKFLVLSDYISAKGSGSISSGMYGSFIFWLLMLGSCISAIRLITAQKRLGLNHKNNIAIDIIIPVLLLIIIVLIFAFLGLLANGTSAN